MNIYAQRRATLARQMEAVGGGVALFNAAPERTRNSDTHHPYRHDSHQFYMCGFPEPDAVLAVVARPGAAPRSILFCRAKHAEREIWEGFRFGPEAAAEKFAIDSAHPIEEIDQHLPPLLANQHAVYYAHGADPEFDRKISTWLIAVQAMRRQGTTAPAAIFDVRTLVDEMRLRKDASEIDTMRRAAAISVAAHSRAMRVCQPGMFEYQIEAELLHEFKMRGSQSPAYGSIVAGGAGACVLHYVANDRRLIEGDLVLIDAGSELDGYASDVTRTFPVSGRFSSAQRKLYELVLAAQHAAFLQVRPGKLWNDAHDAALAVLAQGMIDLKLLQGSLAEVLESGSYRQFYMHRTGHWLGMDVHDVGDYRLPGSSAPEGGERPWRPLAPGMVLTVEPGIYVRPAAGVPEEFFNIGIRIEDDVVVTDSGHEVLSAALPTAVDAIETLMGKR